MDGGNPITRSLGRSSTSGFIPNDAPHWSIESYIPVQTHVLIDYLLDRNELTPEVASTFRDVCSQVDRILRQRTIGYQGRFADRYWSVDPDNDGRTPGEPGVPAEPELVVAETDDQVDPASKLEVTELLQLCEEVLSDAAYRRLSHEEIAQCVGVASQWGVPLYVDFALFEQLHVFARGDIVGTKLRRRLRRLYRPEPVSVPIYQRMVVLFHLKHDSDSEEQLSASSLHARLFKNIPKQDVDTLLPGTRVRITKIDRVKIIVPSLGGLVMSLRKIIQFLLIFAALTFYSTAVLGGLILATIGYVVKSILSYSQTKNRYLLNLTRNLYFQKLDTNAGAVYRIIQQAHAQTSMEAILAYYAIITSDQPLSKRRLQRRCERIIREAVQVEVDFRVDFALQRLCEMGRVKQTADEHWTVDANVSG